jgi:hypothetical protein
MPDWSSLSSVNFDAIEADLLALAPLVILVAQVMGFFLVGGGLLKAIRSAGRSPDGDSHLFGGAGLTILCGACLLSIETFAQMAGFSVGGKGLTDVSLAMGEVSQLPQAQFYAAVRIAFGIAWLVGLLGVISGLNTLRHQGQNRQAGFAITKIVGGACAMNLSAFIAAASRWGGIFEDLAAVVN